MRTLIFACALAAVAVPAFAQDASLDAASVIARADANGDGAVSRDELLDARAAAFSRLDRDGDGVFRTSDIPARAASLPRAQQAIQAAQRFDSDGDGAVTEAEFVNGPTAAFDAADEDADGVVTAVEIEALRASYSAAQR